LAVFARRWRWDIAIIHMNWGPCKVWCVWVLVNAPQYFHGPLTVNPLPVEPLDTTLGCFPFFNVANASDDVANNIAIITANLIMWAPL
jgi:hypothetical protein